MIELKEENIVFIPNQRDKEHPPQREFPLLSGYVCPFCSRILVAYFQGEMSEADIEYYRKNSAYIMCGVSGGFYLKPENHQGHSYEPDHCSWEEFTRRGIVENLRLFAERHELPRILVQFLAGYIHSLTSFCVVEDVCSKDGEMLLFSEDRMLKSIKEKHGPDAYWKAKENLGEYIMGLMKCEESLKG